MARAHPAASAMSSMLVAFRPCPATHTAVAARMRSAMSLDGTALDGTALARHRAPAGAGTTSTAESSVTRIT